MKQIMICRIIKAWHNWRLTKLSRRRLVVRADVETIERVMDRSGAYGIWAYGDTLRRRTRELASIDHKISKLTEL